MLAIRMIKVLTIGLMLAALFAGAGGCQTVGPKNTFDRGGATLQNPSPVTLDIQDNDKRGTASGVGPSRWTSVTGDEVQTLQTGSTPRDLFFKNDKLQFNLSSGTDISASGLEYDPATGSLKIANFSTIASTPTRATNEAYDRLVAYFQSLSKDQLEALKAEQATVQAVAPTAANVIQAIINAAMTGGAVP